MASVACTRPPVRRQSRKRVDGAEGEVPGLRQRARAVDVVEQPGDLGGREVGIEQQPGLGRDHRLVARGLELAAGVGGAPVLPDDGVVDRLAGAPVPEHAGLALVGDADGGDVAGAEPGGGQRLARRLDRRAPDVLGIVLHPAVGREVLGELALGEAEDRQVRAEHDGAARRGALIDRQDAAGLAHASSPILACYCGPMSCALRRRQDLPAGQGRACGYNASRRPSAPPSQFASGCTARRAQLSSAMSSQARSESCGCRHANSEYATPSSSSAAP